MINNQIFSAPGTGNKESVLPGKGTDGADGAGKREGGLFKLLMSYSQHEGGSGSLQGKKQKNDEGSANILGGNITLGKQTEDGNESSVLHLLSGEGVSNKDEKAAATKLLEGSETSDDSERISEDPHSDVKNVSGEAENAKDKEYDQQNAAVSGEAEQQVLADAENVSARNEERTGSDAASGRDSSELTGADLPDEEANSKSTAGLKTDSQSGSGLNESAQTASNEGMKVQGRGKGEPAENAVPNSKMPSGAEVSLKDNPGILVQGVPGDVIQAADDSSADKNGDRPAKEADVRELLKNSGLVNELRAMAALRGEHLMTGDGGRPQMADEPAAQQALTDISPGGEEAIENIFAALQSGTIEQAAAEIRSIKAGQLREMRYQNYQSSFANRSELSFSNQSVSTSGGTVLNGSTQANLPKISASGIVPSSASISGDILKEDGAILWKEHFAEYLEANEKVSSDNQASALTRLAQIPVTNISVKRNFAQGIGQGIMNATADGKKASEHWQKHNFMLENGKNIQVSAREVDGVLQLKLSSSFSELNKLLIDHQDEIRELLENEIELKIDLQLDGDNDGQLAEFFGGSSQQGNSRKAGVDMSPGTRRTTEQEVEEVLPKAVRKFGYNQMEWTA